MRVLITGGSGFLGTYARAALETAGHEVLAYDLVGPGAEMLAVTPDAAGGLRQGSLADRDRLLEVCRADRIEAVVHAAARLGLEASLRDPADFYATNIGGFVNVCEAARTLDLAKVVLVSSNAVYHPAPGGTLGEADAVFSPTRANPAAHYGTSKMAAEAIGMAYAEFHGVDFLALRVTAVYGFGMRSPLHVKPMVENSILKQPTRFATGGPMKRDYTYVLDCCRAIVLAVAAPRQPTGTQRVFNVSAGRLQTAAGVAGIVRTILPGADIEIGEGLSPLEEGNLRMRAALDSSAAGRVLGWAPAWSIEDGIRDYADRFKHYVGCRGN